MYGFGKIRILILQAILLEVLAGCLDAGSSRPLPITPSVTPTFIAVATVTPPSTNAPTETAQPPTPTRAAKETQDTPSVRNSGPSLGERALSIQAITQAPPGKYLFAEIRTTVSGSGTLPMQFVDFPNYQFDAASGILKPYVNPELPTMTPNQLGFIGVGTRMVPPAGSGEYSGVTPLETFPFEQRLSDLSGLVVISSDCKQPIDVELLAVSRMGELEANIAGKRIVLKPNERWTCRAGQEYREQSFNGTYLYEWMVGNYGWQDRTKIQFGK